jgi:hypothetical protein
MEKMTPVRRPFIVATVVIVVVLAFQAGSTFKLFCPPDIVKSFGIPALACDPALYPFMQYPMYSLPHYAGDPVNMYEIYGTLSNGTELRILPEDLNENSGLDFWYFLDFAEAIIDGDEELITRFADAYERRREVQLVSLRVEDVPWIVELEGVKPGSRQVIASASVGD